MDLKNLADKAKELIDKRGGSDSLKEDAGELKDIASSEGSLADKAKDAVEAIKDPGADDVADAPALPPTEAPGAGASDTATERPGKRKRDGRGKHERGGRRHGRDARGPR